MADFIRSAEWQALRLEVLERDLWLCRMCGVPLRQGRRHMQSAIVDHTIPRSLRPDLEDDRGNLRSVCRACHGVCASIEAKHGTDEGAIRRAKEAYRPVGMDGYPMAN